MKREVVESSNLRSIGYDAEKEVLEVEFAKGGVYVYSGVPEEIYKAIMNAESKGSAFFRYIKSRGYKYERVE